ncbi:Uncharacterised protein [Vibrio cholerae]|nr:Uncharacterised protein [Vibrio cholerae]
MASIGCTSTYMVSTAETGLPGKPQNHAFCSAPNAKGLPGLIASFQKPISPSSSKISLV